ncbi:MAG TPA: T9SS type A sorting domain-containing protein, partial [Flavitalea sp.]|nr:T9SS type A sorting domain-containing protein [Flavitalea sp.]
HYNVTEREYYYRIKQVDIDGNYSYSKIVKVIADGSSTNSVKLLSNPVLNNLVVGISARQTFVGALNITDASGRLVYKRSTIFNAGNNIINLGTFNQSPGTYYLIFTGVGGEKEVVEFIKR